MRRTYRDRLTVTDLQDHPVVLWKLLPRWGSLSRLRTAGWKTRIAARPWRDSLGLEGCTLLRDLLLGYADEMSVASLADELRTVR